MGVCAWTRTFQIAASDEAVLAMHALQDELREGPAVDALRHHETVYAPDLRSDERRPRWGPGVHDMGCAGPELSVVHDQGHAGRPVLTQR